MLAPGPSCSLYANYIGVNKLLGTNNPLHTYTALDTMTLHRLSDPKYALIH